MDIIGEILYVLANILFIINILFGVLIIFFERKEPAVTWAWLMVIAFIPYVGFGIYMILGFDSRKHSKFAAKARQDVKTFDSILKMDMPGFKFAFRQKSAIDLKTILNVPGADHLNDLVSLNYSSGMGAFSTNNKVDIFSEGTPKFDKMIEDIANAKSYVHLLYYIMKNDDLGRKIINALAEKARQGVEVKLLVDGMGCFWTPQKFYRPLIEAGGEVGIFLPPLFIRVNFRNHRKKCVIDGNTGYIGGLNIGEEYLGTTKRFGYWRDSHIRITGDSAKELEIRFILDWNFSSANKIVPYDKYFPVLDKVTEGVPMQIVSSGPDTKWANILFAYAKIISEADKNIYIQTPYFVPDESVLNAIKIAALSGIDVRIMFPAHPDHPFVYWASLSFLGELLDAGVRCYKYEKGFIHSKLIVMDGLVTSTGTANMDIRSFKLNFEINAFMYDRHIANAFEIKFLEDLKDCTEITKEWYDKRSRITKVKESVSRLLSPLL